MPLRLCSIVCGVFLATSSLSIRALELPLPTDGSDLVGQVQVIKAKYEDTFAEIGEQYDLGYSELVAANPGVDPWLPGEGTEIVLPTRYILPPGPREGVVINLAEYRLFFFPEDRPVVYTYPLGIGREGWASPVANTRIVAKIPNPAWYPPQSIRDEHLENEGEPLPRVVPPGPDNPLGPYKLPLGVPGYLIHGSNRKFGIGMRVSHGCFRMLNNNVLEFASMVPKGAAVRIVDLPYKLGRDASQRLYLEAHEPLVDKEGEVLSLMDRHNRLVDFFAQPEQAAIVESYQLDWDAMRSIVAGEDGLPIMISDQLLTDFQSSSLEELGQQF